MSTDDTALRQQIETEFGYRLRTVAAYFRARGKYGEQPDPDYIPRHLHGGISRLMDVLDGAGGTLPAATAQESVAPPAREIATSEELALAPTNSYFECGCGYHLVKAGPGRYLLTTGRTLTHEEVVEGHLPVAVLYTPEPHTNEA